MVLDSLERFALVQLLGMAGVLRTRWELMEFDVLGRERTTSGYYTLIKPPKVLESLPSPLELILPITHYALRRGGYFVCWMEDSTTICLEAVANRQPWPQEISPVDVCWVGKGTKMAWGTTSASMSKGGIEELRDMPTNASADGMALPFA